MPQCLDDKANTPGAAIYATDYIRVKIQTLFSPCALVHTVEELTVPPRQSRNLTQRSWRQENQKFRCISKRVSLTLPGLLKTDFDLTHFIFI